MKKAGAKKEAGNPSRENELGVECVFIEGVL
jgi:hypothetical protein